MFPLGTWLKKDVKQLAVDIGLNEIRQKRESMGICFIGKRDFNDFLAEYLDPKPGIMVDIETGRITGHHDGMHQYTIGKRIRCRTPVSERMYAVQKVAKNRTILVAPNINHPALYFDLFYTNEAHWIDKSPFELDKRKVVNVEFRFQHGHKLEKCSLFEDQHGLIVTTETPIKAICSGQFAVFYRDNECLGSAKISASGPSMYFSSDYRTVEEDKETMGDEKIAVKDVGAT